MGDAMLHYTLCSAEEAIMNGPLSLWSPSHRLRPMAVVDSHRRAVERL